MSNKIAITVTGTSGLDQPMDPRFGRTPVFLIVDVDTGEVAATEVNGSSQASHGAGTGSAAAMRKHGVSGVISGRFGPKAFEALSAMGVAMWTAPPGLTAREALEKYRAGELTQEMVKVFR